MFELILKELKTKYKDLGLGDAILKAKAKQIEKAVKEETEIENAVIGAEDDLKIYQSIADASRTKISELERKLAETKPTEEKPKVEDVKPTDTPSEDVPAWAKALIDANTKLSEGLSAIQQKETNQTNAQKLSAKLKELNVSDQFSQFHVNGKSFNNDEEIESFANQLLEAETNYKQSVNDDKAKDFANPVFGQKPKEGVVSADVQHFIDSTFKPKS